MPKPNYASLLAQIAAETDPDEKDDLIEDCYQFTEELTAAEKELFNYVSSDYMEDTPGTTTSYVGIYYGNSGIIS